MRIRTHELYTQPRVDFFARVLDQIEWTGSEAVLDVGCGTGAYRAGALERGRRYTGVDVSRGMAPDALADAEHLPFPDASMDVVFANHMLYHVSDIPAAVAELARVGRTVLVATNSENSMRELTEARHRAGARADPVDVRFSLENGGDHLRASFSNVDRRPLDAELVFPDAEPVLAYVESCRSFFDDGNLDWDAFLDRLRDVIGDGEFRVNKTAGVFVCS